MRIRKYLKIGKPSVKGGIMVLIGIFNSRLGIGVEIFTLNLIYGPIAYLFLTLSGIMVVKLIQILDNPSYNGIISIKRALIISGVLYLIGLILIIVNVIENMFIYYLNIVIIIFAFFIGILWCFLGFFSYKYRKSIPIVNILIVTLIFSLGIIFGAFLNTFIIPIHIYFFFFSISFLQISRELTKGFIKQEKELDFMQFTGRLDENKLLKFSLFFQVFAILFLILAIFNVLTSTALILFVSILGIVIISLASFLTLASILEKVVYKKISSILKIGILLELIILLVLGK